MGPNISTVTGRKGVRAMRGEVGKDNRRRGQEVHHTAKLDREGDLKKEVNKIETARRKNWKKMFNSESFRKAGNAIRKDWSTKRR